MIDLLPFCSKDETRPILMSPFNANGYTYATDGAILVRVPALPEWETKESDPKPPGCSKMYQDFPARNDPRFVPLKGQPTGEEMVTCSRCHGSGAIICEEFREPDFCPNCDGEKTHPNREAFHIGVRAIAMHLALKMCRLPGLLVATEYFYEANKLPMNLHPLPFIFDGGDGLLMPMRKGEK